ncbi:MAG: hypothetical protein AUK47_25780 [Deltaproteobacteria bacterium CG2_30_63_29]|nr:MAG: hypothetical protein AUK47_25780 [Deltaproteobacteria bacterium CG2_30_63_29]
MILDCVGRKKGRKIAEVYNWVAIGTANSKHHVDALVREPGSLKELKNKTKEDLVAQTPGKPDTNPIEVPQILLQIFLPETRWGERSSQQGSRPECPPMFMEFA